MEIKILPASKNNRREVDQDNPFHGDIYRNIDPLDEFAQPIEWIPTRRNNRFLFLGREPCLAYNKRFPRYK